MTKIYFVRHARPDYSVKDDKTRPLTEEGLADSKLVTTFLLEQQISQVYSSPYQRAYDTVKDFADTAGLPININEDFRERRIDSVWIDDFNEFARQQWSDLDYRLTDGECLREVQSRNIKALTYLLEQHDGQNIVVGSHGTALCTILKYFNNHFNYLDFERIRPLMPFVVCFSFEGKKLRQIEEFDPKATLKK